jgi:signal transduction histidine kinase
VGDVVCVDVHNEGPGIERDRLAEIFEKMARLDSKREGTGLGLYITRYLVEAQGGSISASSSPDEGVSFRFTIPAAAGSAARQATST